MLHGGATARLKKGPPSGSRGVGPLRFLSGLRAPAAYWLGRRGALAGAGGSWLVAQFSAPL
ncbi:hypothetical protein GCM10017771_47860 [Streptomyces capitiformicae]|uniref:Uncharacterized protein n=1 Tax=Streptomyces capitiformicae TaxID=2014920 RepID=A0A918Z066_9ACTN|nr:hypothetical protein GCM10017771_47860 [Streptomyces capitiformicae]